MKIKITINGKLQDVEINDAEKTAIYQAIDREYKKEDVLNCIENGCFNLTENKIKEVEKNIDLITNRYKKIVDDYGTEWQSIVEQVIDDIIGLD